MACDKKSAQADLGRRISSSPNRKTAFYDLGRKVANTLQQRVKYEMACDKKSAQADLGWQVMDDVVKRLHYVLQFQVYRRMSVARASRRVGSKRSG